MKVLIFDISNSTMKISDTDRTRKFLFSTVTWILSHKS